MTDPRDLDVSTHALDPSGAGDITKLLDELERLRVDPHATDVDWLGFFERRADLLTRIAWDMGTEEAHVTAAAARAQVAARWDALDGGASGRW